MHHRVDDGRRYQRSHVLAADGYLFVTPENLATMAGRMKDFFDRIYYGALDKINGRPYAAIIAAGTDGEGAARQIQRIATGLRLKEIAPPLIVRNGAQTPEQILAPKQVPEIDLSRARELGRGDRRRSCERCVLAAGPPRRNSRTTAISLSSINVGA